MKDQKGPIGVFDSGYGGLTVFREIINVLPQYDFIYLGDNARVPYGNRSMETVYQYTLECVNKLFDLGCRLVILACNTASAKALRTIQQNNLDDRQDLRRVLGVIRPTAEVIGCFTKSNKVGVLATQGTVESGSYETEIKKLHPDIKVYQEACPMWVPLVENGLFNCEGADFFIKTNVENLLQKNPEIDVVILGCTHYPLLSHKIEKLLPPSVKLLSQGRLVADSLKMYLERHPELDDLCTKYGTSKFYTTDSAVNFDKKAGLFLGRRVQSEFIEV